MKTLDFLQGQKRQDILALGQKHGVEKIQVFGSVAREEDTEKSDVDFLISVPPAVPFDLFRFWCELEDIVGREVDVVDQEAVYWAMKPQILQEARSL